MRVVASFAGLVLLLAVTATTPATVAAQMVSPSVSGTPDAAAAPATPAAATPATATPAGTLAPAATAVVEGAQVVELTQVVTPGAAPVTVFTAPADATLLISDILVTNPNTSAVCGVDLARGSSPVTGGLCVPPQSSLPFTFVTGVEVPPGTALALSSAAEAAGPVVMHVRGILTPQTIGTGTGTGTTTPPAGG